LYNKAFAHEFFEIWIAPAEGLYLKTVNYDEYNKKDSIFEALILDENEVKK
jgi:tRNA U38,U39,U40 pseudouridine synthase TruA